LSPGCARTRCGVYSAPPDPLAAFDGTRGGERWENERRKGKGGEDRGREGRGDATQKNPVENS